MTHVLLKLLINISFLTLGEIINACGRDTRERGKLKKRIGERHFAMDQGVSMIYPRPLFKKINKELIGSGVKEQGLWCQTSPDFESSALTSFMTLGILTKSLHLSSDII